RRRRTLLAASQRCRTIEQAFSMRPSMRRVAAPLPFTTAAALAWCAAAAPASAQRGSDAEDGAGLYAAACPAGHGEHGDSIEGIDLGRGQFGRPLTDHRLARLIMHGIPNAAMLPADLDEEEVEELVLFLRDNARPR